MPCCSCKSAGTCALCSCTTAGERCTDCYPSRASKCSNSTSAASLSQPHPRITRSQVAVVNFVGQNFPSSLPPLSSSSLPLLPSLSPSAKAHDLANDGSRAEQNSQRAEQNIQRSFPSQTNDSHLSLSLFSQNLRRSSLEEQHSRRGTLDQKDHDQDHNDAASLDRTVTSGAECLTRPGAPTERDTFPSGARPDGHHQPVT